MQLYSFKTAFWKHRPAVKMPLPPVLPTANPADSNAVWILGCSAFLLYFYLWLFLHKTLGNRKISIFKIALNLREWLVLICFDRDHSECVCLLSPAVEAGYRMWCLRSFCHPHTLLCSVLHVEGRCLTGVLERVSITHRAHGFLHVG